MSGEKQDGSFMKTAACAFLLMVSMSYAGAQDEGVIEKKAQFKKGKSLYLNLGPSFRVLNTSDYTIAFSVEAGFSKRVNRKISIGPSLTLTQFNYTPSYSDSFKDSKAKGNNVYQEDGGYEMYVVDMDGGNLTFISLGLNAQINFKPFEEGKWSVYGLAKLSGFMVSRNALSASVDIWYANTIPYDDPKNWSGGDPFESISSNTPGLERWAKDSELGALLTLGIGADYPLSPSVTLKMLGSFGLTTSITQIQTSHYPPSRNDGYYHPQYPFVKEGFRNAGVSIGIAYNF